MAEEVKATIEEIRMILKFMAKGYKVPKIIHDTIFEIAKREIEEKDRVVIYKRDPNIGSRRIQGARVKIIDGATIVINPTSCTGFGADFDGDQMAIYAPISQEAQKEIKEKLFSATSNESLGSKNFNLTMEMITGIFTLTYTEKGGAVKQVKTIDEVEKLHIGQKVKMKFRDKNIETTAGRIIFNNTLPEKYPFIDEVIDKPKVTKILDDFLKIDQSLYVETTQKLMDLGFKYSTLYPKTFSLDQMRLNPKLIELKDKLSKEKDVSRQSDIDKQMETVLIEFMKKEDMDIYYWVASGGAKGTNQIKQIMVAKGLISDPDGNILPPVIKSIGDGYTPEEYFNASAGSRKGIIDRAINTGKGGYAYRKMVFCIGNVTFNKEVGDCGTRNTLDIKLTNDIYKRLGGRNILDKINKPIPIDKSFIGKVIRLRSPIFCRSLGICKTCYGELYKQVKSKNIGIIAAQEVTSLSEKIMKAFHLGGAVIMKKVDIISEIIGRMEDDYKAKIEKIIKQEENDIINLSDLVIITIDKTLYTEDNKIEETDDYYILPVGVFIFSSGDIEIKVEIEKETKIYKKTSNFEETADKLILMYSKGYTILKVEQQKEDFSKLAQKLDELVAGKSPWFDAVSLYNRFYRNMSVVGGWDSVHLEVIISNILRAKSNPQKPARLVEPFEPVMFSIKKLPSIISYPLGIAYEDFHKSIQYGMISERSPESNIEKILFGQSLVEKKK